MPFLSSRSLVCCIVGPFRGVALMSDLLLT
jgi:hypothetical protein